MAFWSSERLRTEATRVNIFDPYDISNIKHGAYEMAVGPEAYITSSESKILLQEKEILRIPSGQFGLLTTEEVVTVPAMAIGFISIRASIKFQGLVNVSGFHVDPGFRGRLKFAVYNAGSKDIVLERGQKIFMMWFGDLSGPTEDVYNKPPLYGISSVDVGLLQGEIASPAALKKLVEDMRVDFDKRIASVEKDITLWKGIAIAVLLMVLAAIARPALEFISGELRKWGHADVESSQSSGRTLNGRPKSQSDSNATTIPPRRPQAPLEP